MSERASEQENTAAVALNDGVVWSLLPGPPGAFHSSRHAEFGVELELEGATWTREVRPDRDAHEQAECEAGWAARVHRACAAA